MWNKDEIKGKGKEVKGTIKDKVGELTDNPTLEEEGEEDRQVRREPPEPRDGDADEEEDHRKGDAEEQEQAVRPRRPEAGPVQEEAAPGKLPVRGEALHELRPDTGESRRAEFEAKVYEGKVKSGSCLISVHSEDSDETKRAKDIFERAGAKDITTAGEVAVPSGDRK